MKNKFILMVIAIAIAAVLATACGSFNPPANLAGNTSGNVTDPPTATPTTTAKSAVIAKINNTPTCFAALYENNGGKEGRCEVKQTVQGQTHVADEFLNGAVSVVDIQGGCSTLHLIDYSVTPNLTSDQQLCNQIVNLQVLDGGKWNDKLQALDVQKGAIVEVCENDEGDLGKCDTITFPGNVVPQTPVPSQQTGTGCTAKTVALDKSDCKITYTMNSGSNLSASWDKHANGMVSEGKITNGCASFDFGRWVNDGKGNYSLAETKTLQKCNGTYSFQKEQGSETYDSGADLNDTLQSVTLDAGTTVTVCENDEINKGWCVTIATP